MLYKSVVNSIVVMTICFSTSAFAYKFGQSLCRSPMYECLKVKAGESWKSLFPDPKSRDIVQKVNRMNTSLTRGMIIAVPKNLNSIDVMDLSPFAKSSSAAGENYIKIDLSELAWGAYDASGNLVNWGPISAGKNYCPDIHRSCRTPTGSYTIYSRQGPNCISHVFPVATHGGAPMPYCMHFHGGFALHGSPIVPGHNASHGCVRLFTEDAEWLNHNFVNVGSTRVLITH